MTRYHVIAAAVLLSTSAARIHTTPRHGVASPPPDAHALVKQAIASVSGNGSLASIRTVHAQGIQHEYVLGNAERAEGPWRIQYSTYDELRDVPSGTMRRVDRTVSTGAAQPVERVTLLTDSVVASKAAARVIGGSPSSYELTSTRVDASPDRALRLADASDALRWDRVVRHYGIDFDVVSFPWRNGRMKLEISRATHFPVAVEIVRPYPDDFRWAAFGDVTVRTELVDWNVQASGVWWPMQQTSTFNGEPLRDVTVTSVTLDTGLVPADTFAVSDSARIQFAANAKQSFAVMRVGAKGPPKELWKDIIRVPDQWTMTMVKQDDGIVIFETHISGQYLDDVIAEAHKRYPGLPVKAIVMTSDPWAHLGGFRQAVARGIPIYVKDASVPFLTMIAKTPHTMMPDLLARSPRLPKFIPVSGKTVIGSGANRIELYPVGGEYGERMLMAYLPAQKLLYAADLIFPNRGPDGKVAPGFSATPVSDLRSAVLRNKLDVDAVFCVQNYPLFDGPAFMRNESKPWKPATPP